MDRGIFAALMENPIDEKLDRVLLHDKEYRKIQDRIKDSMEEFKSLGLPGEQWLVVDKLLSLHAESGCCYGRAAYQQGVRDCAALLCEMGLIKKEWEEQA